MLLRVCENNELVTTGERVDVVRVHGSSDDVHHVEVGIGIADAAGTK